jgi:hypothetical protein
MRAESKADYSQLDVALEQLAGFGPDLSNGMTSHAPMVVEALAALGRADATLPWLDTYRHLLLPRPAARDRIERSAWRAALAKPERTGDWNAFFANELADAPWRDVLARWTARLAPGYCAAATHGVLRVGHAARALAHGETPLRVRELGDALAAWAANYQTLPTGAAQQSRHSVRDAIAAVPLVPETERVFTGTIVSSLEGLDRFAPFAGVIDLLDVDAPVARLLSALTEGFARVYLANARDGLTTIVFVHGVTSIAALRGIAPVLAPDDLRDATRYAWQSSSALYAAFGSQRAAIGEIEPPRESAESIVERAIASHDDHAIKFTEACLREHAIAPSPAYLAAASHAVEVLSRPTS